MTPRTVFIWTTAVAIATFLGLQLSPDRISVSTLEQGLGPVVVTSSI